MSRKSSFQPVNIASRDKWVPVTTAWRVLRLRMDERPPIWRVAANLLNKQSRTADKGCCRYYEFVCFDIAAWPGYTIPFLFSSFSGNEAETRKKQTVRMLREATVQNALSVKFFSVVTTISAMKLSCCWIHDSVSQSLLAIWFATRDKLPKFVIITCPNFKKKRALWPQILFIGRLVHYRYNGYLDVLTEVRLLIIWLLDTRFGKSVIACHLICYPR
jgi:hypothetical protein